MSQQIRKIRQTFLGMPVTEGAGVRLTRLFGNPQVPLFDPFLLMDDFHSSNPDDYLAGFPMHPHRGIETITYLLHGTVAHRDSLGNSGLIRPGEVQWMTAGSGIIHEEMPQRSKPELWGFQLWSNLPASQKMMAPRYRNIRSEQIPQVSPKDKVTIKVICGTVGGVEGPVRAIVTDPDYLDITLAPDTVYDHPVKPGYTVFCYVAQGEGCFAGEAEPVGSGRVVLFDDGDAVRMATTALPVRCLLIAGRPIGEPVAWAGPIVMNSQEELTRAFEEFRDGTFIKSGG